MPGTGLSITYEKTEENRLMASSFHARKPPNENAQSHLSKIPQPGMDSGKREGKGAGLDLSLARGWQVRFWSGRRFLRPSVLG
jgi:hypothetical protein